MSHIKIRVSNETSALFTYCAWPIEAQVTHPFNKNKMTNSIQINDDPHLSVFSTLLKGV